ncbi:group III truncated hemoglobin [Siculibacillus lacustris]|nr:group III truncated hemoglobin [Siculibacillus lacustris]
MERDLMNVATPGPEAAQIETAIVRMVRRFYAGWTDDALLAPILAALPEPEAHLAVIVDFWSRQLLGTERYQGKPFPPHWALKIEPAHFDRWMALFAEAARAELPADTAEQAITKAGHMSVAFQAGLFPLRGPDGRPMRLPH